MNPMIEWGEYNIRLCHCQEYLAGHNPSASSQSSPSSSPAMASKADPYAGIEFEEINEATGEWSSPIALLLVKIMMLFLSLSH